jgi:hypothetical protein
MGNEKTMKLFKGIVEIDKTYVGGKPRKINAKLDKEGRPIFSGKKFVHLTVTIHLGSTALVTEWTRTS